jgi:hypothetical protein
VQVLPIVVEHHASLWLGLLSFEESFWPRSGR